MTNRIFFTSNGTNIFVPRFIQEYFWQVLIAFAREQELNGGSIGNMNILLATVAPKEKALCIEHSQHKPNHFGISIIQLNIHEMELLKGNFTFPHVFVSCHKSKSGTEQWNMFVEMERDTGGFDPNEKNQKFV